jgi:hypothetical protein
VTVVLTSTGALQAMFKCYTGGTERMYLPQWMQFLSHADLLNTDLLHVGRLNHDATAPAQRCFAQSALFVGEGRPGTHHPLPNTLPLGSGVEVEL